MMTSSMQQPRMRRPGLRGQRSAGGFTLVEVLVALAIVAITLGAGLRVGSSQISSAQRQRDTFLAQICADNELIKLRLSRQFPSVGDRSFNCEQAGQVFQGRFRVETTPNPSFRKVDVVIFQTVAGRSEEYTLVKISTLAGVL